jgi:hypothetical protein
MTFIAATSMFGPKSKDVVPTRNPEPVRFTVRVWPLDPDVGEAATKVGSGLPTRKPFVSVAVPPAGGEFVTMTFRLPIAAPAEISSVTAICVELVTVNAETVVPSPASTVVAPDMKSVPVICTVTAFPRGPIAGVTAVIPGIGLLTANLLESVAVPPPGPVFVTETFPAPAAAENDTVARARISVELTTVTESKTIPVPKSIDVDPG